ncbi:MAG: replication factor C large subunit [Methanobrevibacter sp.]|jgi:replication factor C large subunit|nr:replication factor C large subunit [Methanobrevibacter sp.]
MRWTEKYRPKYFKDVIGNGNAKKEIEGWLNNWKNNQVEKPLLLIGPAGTGKTTMAHIIANEFGDSFELNASDERTYQSLLNTAGISSDTYSLFEKGHKLIILDEVDGIDGKKDKGGTRAIGKIIKEAKHPMIMMANDFYSKRLTSIKPKCIVVKLTKVHTNSINALLKKIAINEGIEADSDSIKALAKNSNGDMRFAINTLQATSQSSKTFTMDDLNETSQKDNRSTIFDGIRTVLKSKNLKRVKESLYLDGDPTVVLEYISENIPNEYKKKNEIKKAYKMVSEADYYFSLARTTQNYTYWRYASDFMGIGVALAKDEKYKKFTKLTGPKAFTYIGHTKGKRTLRDNIAEKISEKLHVSKSEAISSFPYFQIMFENDELAWEISDFLSLDDDEIKRFRKKKIPKKGMTKMEKIKAENNFKEPDQSNNLVNSLDNNLKINKIKTSNKTKTTNKKESKSVKEEDKNKKTKGQTSLFNF